MFAYYPRLKYGVKESRRKEEGKKWRKDTPDQTFLPKNIFFTYHSLLFKHYLFNKKSSTAPLIIHCFLQHYLVNLILNIFFKFKFFSLISLFKGSPSEGSEHPRMFWSYFAPPDIRVLYGINRFLIKENRFWNWFSKQSTRKIQNTPSQTSFRSLKTGFETG